MPMLVHFATNDTNVNYEEAVQLVDALRARKPGLAEVAVYERVHRLARMAMGTCSAAALTHRRLSARTRRRRRIRGTVRGRSSSGGCGRTGDERLARHRSRETLRGLWCACGGTC